LRASAKAGSAVVTIRIVTPIFQTQAATIAQHNFCKIQNNGQIGKMTWYCLMIAD
jgi:hypothetical protein